MTTILQSEVFMNSPVEEATDLGGGIRRTLLGYDDKILMAKVWFEAEAVGAVHTHPHSQVTYIVSGQFAAEVGGQTQLLGEGGCFFVPSMAPHGVVCVEPGILIDVFSPAREDFLAVEE